MMTWTTLFLGIGNSQHKMFTPTLYIGRSSESESENLKTLATKSCVDLETSLWDIGPGMECWFGYGMEWHSCHISRGNTPQTLHRLAPPLSKKLFGIFFYYMQLVTHDRWHVTRDRWHMTGDRWHVTCDTQHRVWDEHSLKISAL